MKRFNSSKVRMSNYLQPASEAQKRYIRRLNGIQMPRAAAVGPKPIDKPKDRDFLTCVKSDYKPPRLRGRSGTRLSDAKRAMVELRRDARAAFFASLEG